MRLKEMELPRSLFDWTDVFKDDSGYEAMEEALPTQEQPGSSGKVAVLHERLLRGQHLWSDADAGAGEAIGGRAKFKHAGNKSYGAIVGEDSHGHRHRYAIWTALPSKRESPFVMQYVPPFASYVDDFDKDHELKAIKRHAMLHGATSVAVTPMYSARIRTERDFVNIPEPITSAGLLWIRLFAKNVQRIVACWGETTMLARHVDVGWTLGRTRSVVYSTEENNPWPPMITRMTGPDLFKWDFYAYRDAYPELDDADDE